MSYKIKTIVNHGLGVVVSMESNITMPAVENINDELDFICSLFKDSEKFYGVPFRVNQPEYNCIEELKFYLEEYYFGIKTRQYHEFRMRPLYRIVIEPLLDDLAQYNHSQILDIIDPLIEQLKEKAFMARARIEPGVDADQEFADAYREYLNMVRDYDKSREVKKIALGIWKLRKNS